MYLLDEGDLDLDDLLEFPTIEYLLPLCSTHSGDLYKYHGYEEWHESENPHGTRWSYCKRNAVLVQVYEKLR